MRILVTGGTGYIGAHTVAALIARGDSVVAVDDVVNGDMARIGNVPLVRLALDSSDAWHIVADTMRTHGVEAVIHFAARKSVEESVEKPAWYFQQNVGGLANLLLGMEDAGVHTLVFSSSAAVYGQANGSIDEDYPAQPINPYGATKLVGEQLITAATGAWPLRAVSLRYFNVAGAASRALADKGGTNLVPQIIEKLDAGLAPVIYGDTYDTPDGTCIRDYVHVVDVAEAHLAALDALAVGEAGALVERHTVLNVGTGTGTSVLEMVSSIARAAGYAGAPTIAEPRPGDAAAVVAHVERIARLTGWSARHTLDDIVTSSLATRAT